jgi:hypothetical protein
MGGAFYSPLLEIAAIAAQRVNIAICVRVKAEQCRDISHCGGRTGAGEQPVLEVAAVASDRIYIA